MHLTKFVHSQTGRYLMSLLLGFGLASAFRTICKDKRCYLYKAPLAEDIDNKIYKQDEKCYNYKKVSTKCNNNMKSVLV
jgi:hypothetical protein